MNPLHRLSPRQHRIAELIAQGLSNHAIGLALRISPNTVANHLYAAFGKLQINNRTALAVLYLEHSRPASWEEEISRPAQAAQIRDF